MRTSTSFAAGSGTGLSVSLKCCNPKPLNSQAFISSSDCSNILLHDYNRNMEQSEGLCQDEEQRTTMRTYLPKQPRREELELSSVLYALSDPIRLDIVGQLASVDSLACGNFRIEKPKSSLSHHFRVLRESGVVATRRDGTALLNSLRSRDLELRFPGLLKAVLGSIAKLSRSTRT